MTLKKKNANLIRIKKVLDWFDNYKSIEYDQECRKIISNYKKLYNSDISIAEIKSIIKKDKQRVYDVSVYGTESFFGNDYPVLLHNSGSKGFHIIVPWKAFPDEINEIKTSEMFPKYPRIIIKYLNEKIKPELVKKITEISISNEYVRDTGESEKVIPDLILVSPRHLFRPIFSS